jgi:hypothetical protein
MMITVCLIQLPIPQLNYGRQTGNVPLGAAWLKQAARGLPDVRVEIVPERIASYLGDAALIQSILSSRPDIIGFTVYSWNAARSLYLAQQLKAHYQPRIIFGGPEITADSPWIRSRFVDFYVYGEGESIFLQLLQDASLWGKNAAGGSSGDSFKTSSSPYLSHFLEPEIENMMLLETQRGCPYRCGYCYYNKSRARLAVADEEKILEAIQWAIDQGIAELYLLDPSLNARPQLRRLLKKIIAINRKGNLAITSEIRAEMIDTELADLFAAAGFSSFEIGLQSTNPAALTIMNRPTDLRRFVRGAWLLKEREMLPRIDLIVGLPGDDLEHFAGSVDFVAGNHLQDDVQIFPLAVLPGTDFRARHRELGLRFESSPPYYVIETPAFPREDMLLAFDYAEVRFDVVLFPFPNLDVSWRFHGGGGSGNTPDRIVQLGGKRYVLKLMLESARPLIEVEALAQRLTQPYQVFVGAALRDQSYLKKVLEILTSANPYSPFEVVFLEPDRLPNTQTLMSAVRLQRPHYLDNDLRYLLPAPGNRAVVFTLVSGDKRRRFSGEMQRQVYWWQQSHLPEMSELMSLSDMEGVLIDVPLAENETCDWQDRFAAHADDIPYISFAEVDLQKRWLLLSAPAEYSAIPFNVTS